ncbi:unnamed protein product [Orchesella dallaii]|uniref:PWWP domain-containing protein n=1 Tax=Orchesella dallaii TaxID=48710 RepID=A0ABP1QWU8_9HEXA
MSRETATKKVRSVINGMEVKTAIKGTGPSAKGPTHPRMQCAPHRVPAKRRTHPRMRVSGRVAAHPDKLEEGSLVWVQQKTWPWWPALIRRTDEDSNEEFCSRKRRNKKNGRLQHEYHAQYLDNPITTHWIEARFVKPYRGRKAGDVKEPTNDPVWDRWEQACAYADYLDGLDFDERTKCLFFDFGAVYPNWDEIVGVKRNSGNSENATLGPVTASRDEMEPGIGDQPTQEIGDAGNIPHDDMQIESEDDGGDHDDGNGRDEQDGQVEVEGRILQIPNWEHEKLAWLQKGERMDGKMVKQGTANYDPTTLFVPDDYIATQPPMMKQWWEFKRRNCTTIYFFKVGNMYKCFHWDAVTVAQKLRLEIRDVQPNVAHNTTQVPICAIDVETFVEITDLLMTDGFIISTQAIPVEEN